MTTSIAVLKIGGSVLTGPTAYRRAAALVASRLDARPDERIVVVVSAEAGETDALLELARSIVDVPQPAALDLLWSTGELRSVAVLALSLQAAGISAAAVDVHQAGLDRSRHCAGNVSVNPLRLRAQLADHQVVVVPGFLARGAADEVVSLGRGGSDLTAVLLAAALDARLCELIKDVPGYFTADPKFDPDAKPVPWLSLEQALEMADAGCEMVQRNALEAARQCRVELLISGAQGSTRTHISNEPFIPLTSCFRKDIDNGVFHADDSCRTAVRTGDWFADCADLPDFDLRAGSARRPSGV
jgi:aspartokinase